MSKSFKGGLDSLLGETPLPTMEKKKIGRPVTQTKVITKSSQEGTKEHETRATFIVNESLLDSMKAIAYWERSMIKTIIAAALEDYIAKYKKEHGGVIRPILPTK